MSNWIKTGLISPIYDWLIIEVEITLHGYSTRRKNHKSLSQKYPNQQNKQGFDFYRVIDFQERRKIFDEYISEYRRKESIFVSFEISTKILLYDFL